MASPLDPTQIIQFSDMVHNKAQQIKARMRPHVKIKKMSGDLFAYDGLGQIEAQEISGRVQKTQFTDIEHLRRKISRRRFAVTIPIDGMEVAGALLNPEAPYAEVCVKAMERMFDRVVVGAFFADVYTGRDFETTVNFATDGGFTVDATAGLTYEKLLEAKQNFLDADVGTDSQETIVMGIAGDENTALLKEAELIHGDYSREYVIDQGDITKALGMQLIKFAGAVQNPILNVTSGSVRECFVASTRGICVGMSQDVKVSIKDRSDYVDTTQVQIVGVFGAVRTEGVLIQKLQTTPV